MTRGNVQTQTKSFPTGNWTPGVSVTGRNVTNYTIGNWYLIQQYNVQVEGQIVYVIAFLWRLKQKVPTPGIEPGTFRSSVWRSPNWAIAADNGACHNGWITNRIACPGTVTWYASNQHYSTHTPMLVRPIAWQHSKCHTCKTTTPTGFEPVRAKPNGLAGRRLNHSAKASLIEY